MYDLDYVFKRDGHIIAGYLDISQGNGCLVPSYFGSFNVVIEAFWVNYPYCYTNNDGQTCTPNIACAAPVGLQYESNGTCVNPPALTPAQSAALSNLKYPISLPNNTTPVVPLQANASSVTFRKDLFDQGDSLAGLDFVTFYNSMHTALPSNTLKFLQNKTVIKLAGVGGWFMGGSIAGTPTGPLNNWAICLSNMDEFVTSLESIVTLGYDGIDLDCETIYAADFTGLSEGCKTGGPVSACYSTASAADVAAQSAAKLISLVQAIRASPILKSKVLSFSPRASDVTLDGADGFMGQVFKEVGSAIDMVNIQFYNEIPDNSITPGSLGANVISILDKVKSYGVRFVQVGVPGKAGNGTCDANDPSMCMSSSDLNALWETSLNQHADGIMVWSITRQGTGPTGCKDQNACSVNMPVADLDWLQVPRSRPSSLSADEQESAPKHTYLGAGIAILVAAAIAFVLGLFLRGELLILAVVLLVAGVLLLRLPSSSSSSPSTPSAPPTQPAQPETCPEGTQLENGYCQPIFVDNCAASTPTTPAASVEAGKPCTRSSDCQTGLFCQATNQCSDEYNTKPLCRPDLTTCYTNQA